MQLPTRVAEYLERQDVGYAVIPHAPTRTLAEAAAACGIKLSAMVRAVLLRDSKGLLLAVIPADHILDFENMNHQLGRSLQPVPGEQAGRLFKDCEAGSIPPLAVPYGILAVVDEAVASRNGDEIYFEPGSHEALVYLNTAAFGQLHSTAFTGKISRPAEALAGIENHAFVIPNHLEREAQQLTPKADLKLRLRDIRRLPSMPGIAHRLLRLRNDPHASVKELSDILAQDPSLASQVIRYARAPFFSYRGEVEDIDTAVTRVLGFDSVLNMTLGLATSKTFNGATEGPLGLTAFWQHAVHSAALCHALAQRMPKQLNVKPGLTYLTGLLHNFGFLLLGHIARPEFFLLNKVIEANSDVPVPLIERRLLGLDHTNLGSLLMASWNMPDELIIAMRHHHDENYREIHAPYANLVQMVDHILKGYGMGDAAEEQVPAVLYTALGLTPEVVNTITENVMGERGGLERLADQLAA